VPSIAYEHSYLYGTFNSNNREVLIAAGFKMRLATRARKAQRVSFEAQIYVKERGFMKTNGQIRVTLFFKGYR
jgi:hypothetical protein